MYLADIFTVQANMAGIPAISVPIGNHPNGMPIGIQFMANKFEEEKLLHAAYAYEQATLHRTTFKADPSLKTNH